MDFPTPSRGRGGSASALRRSSSNARPGPPPNPGPPSPCVRKDGMKFFSEVMTVTGTPSFSTRFGRSRRNHREDRLGSVEMMISSKFPSRTAFWTDVNGSAPPRCPRPGHRQSAGASARRSRAPAAPSRSVTSGISSANSHGPLFLRRLTSSSSRGVADVRFATTSTRVFGCVSMSTPSRRIGVGTAKPTTQAPTSRVARASCRVEARLSGNSRLARCGGGNLQ